MSKIDPVCQKDPWAEKAEVIGRALNDNLLLERIAKAPIWRETKIIGEAGDADGAYQARSFSGRRWAEWNGSDLDQPTFACRERRRVC